MKSLAGILLILILVGAAMCAGCTDTTPPAETPVSTPTPQIVYVTVTVPPPPTFSAMPTSSPSPIATPVVTSSEQSSEDPILGNWENSSDSGIYRVDFLVGGEFTQSIRPSGEAESHAFGIWQERGNDKYSTTVGTTISSWTYNQSTGCLVMDSAPNAPFIKDSMTPQISPAVTTSVTTPSPTLIPTTTAGPVGSNGNYFSGSDNGEVNFTVSAPSMTFFQMSYTGNSNFTVWLEDSQGYQIGMLAGVNGPYSGESSFRLNPGVYYLDIKTAGPWTISTTTGT